jgi:NAD(P)-dependent dehydrogenase (short-subunit alcohol dehydrogenase family)
MSIVLITGASRGFGQLAALEFARRGDTVYAMMRNPEHGAPLIEAGGASIRVGRLDVADQASVDTAIAAVLQQAGRIDVLVNNAGIHRIGAMEDVDETMLRDVMETNFFGAIRVTRAVLPSMRREGAGRIIMVSSLGGLLSRACDGPYCASKFALEAASEALRFEVERFGIRVSVVQPSAFRTAIVDNADVSEAYLRDSPYGPLLRFRLERIRDACANGEDPQAVARLIVEIAHARDPQFRYPVGSTALRLVEEMKHWDDSTRAAALARASQVGWWVEGRDRPD